MSRGWFFVILSTIAVSWLGCSIDDGDRCPDGYFYVPEILACCVEGEVYVADAGICREPPEPPDTETDEDDGGADGGDPSGLWEPCNAQEECEGFDADYCAINPLTDEGYCTIECEVGDCPDGSQCCDCTNEDYPIACILDEDVPMIEMVCVGCE
jgi:hypothetical protein